MSRKHDFDAVWKSILEAFEVEVVELEKGGALKMTVDKIRELYYKQKGREEGREEGREKGREEGKEKKKSKVD